MTRPNEIALTPASLATDGEQGEGAKTRGPCEAEHSPLKAQALFLALSAINAARGQLDRYALATDDPMPCVVDAADLLDATMQALSAELNSGWIFAGFSDAIKGMRGGDA